MRTRWSPSVCLFTHVHSANRRLSHNLSLIASNIVVEDSESRPPLGRTKEISDRHLDLLLCVCPQECKRKLQLWLTWEYVLVLGRAQERRCALCGLAAVPDERKLAVLGVDTSWARVLPVSGWCRVEAVGWEAQADLLDILAAAATSHPRAKPAQQN